MICRFVQRLSLIILVTCLSGSAWAKSPPASRGGFFLRAQPMFGGHFMTSQENVVAGFSIHDPSSSRAVGGGVEFEVGGGVAPNFVLSGYLRVASFTSIRAHVNETSVALRGISFHQASFGASVSYFFGPDWYAGARAGFLTQWMGSGPLFDATTPPGFSDAALGGPALGLGLGKEWRIHKQVWVGVEARVDSAALGDDLKSLNTFVLMPQCAVHLTWF